MKTRLKICGITNLADARYCAAGGADYLGFIQYDASPRFLSPGAAKEIIDWLYGPQTVGVFVNASPDAVNRAADVAGFDLVQLQGEETPAACARVERPVIKAFHVHPDTTPDALRARIAPYRSVVDHILLDTGKAGLWGGTGHTFDWEVARILAEEMPVFLAGGLHADNVAEAVRRVRPFAVDLASGVEAAPGQKDFDKLAAFFETFERVADTR